MKVLSGKEIRPLLKEEIINKLQEKKISFLLYLDKENEDCNAYLKSIEKLLSSFSIEYRVSYYDKNKNEEENLLEFKNEIKDSSVLILRPLGVKNEKSFIDSIPSSKDPDMLTDINRGILFSGNLNYLPATAKSVEQIVKHYHVETKGKKVLVVGRSLSVGLAMFELFQVLDATVTLAHSKTSEEDLKLYAKQADIIVLASGRKNLIKREWLSKKTTIIDCGYSYNSGDLGFVPEEDELVAYTPVPGGVGSLTSYCLLLNALNIK